MPDTTPNLGLILSRYEDQEHLEYNSNWKTLDHTRDLPDTRGIPDQVLREERDLPDTRGIRVTPEIRVVVEHLVPLRAVCKQTIVEPLLRSPAVPWILPMGW